jgi:hypothetical protein
MSQALMPRFLVLEARVNPMPNLGTCLKDREPQFYDNAQISGSFNRVKALTARLEEPCASSIFAGNVVDFDVPGNEDVRGKDHPGCLCSTGNYHIKDNEFVTGRWWEFGWKIKGDRKSPAQKLCWGFRIGAKLHGDPDITDIVCVSFRRSMLNCRTMGHSFFTNSGFEYSLDRDRRTFSTIRHYFFVDKKWPFENRQIAFSPAAGCVWESKIKYMGALAAGREKDDFQIILRPNIEF